MTIYKVVFGNTKFTGEHNEYNVKARSISEAEKVAIKLFKSDKDKTQKGRWTRSVEFVVETDN